MKDIHKIAWLLLAAVLVIPSASYAQSNPGPASAVPVSGTDPGGSGKRTIEKGHHVKKQLAKPEHGSFAKKSGHKMKGGSKGGTASGGTGATTSAAPGH